MERVDEQVVDDVGERVDAALAKAQEQFTSTVYEAEHPAVRVHPETTERSLVLGGFARTVLGYSPQASRYLIRVLQEYITRPEQTVRWQWREGDLAIWDNRATQHYAIFDYDSAHRRGERVTVAGPVPVGVDGLERDLEALVQQAADRVKARLGPDSPKWQSFWRTAVQKQAGKEVAGLLDVSVAAVHQNKSRVARLIREEVARLRDEAALGLADKTVAESLAGGAHGIASVRPEAPALPG